MTSRTTHRPPALGRSLLLQAGSFALGLSMHMLLSRWLGSGAYGDLSATLSVALLAATLALFGFDRAATQTLPAYGAESRGALATAFARVALLRVLLAAMVVSLLAFFGTRLVERAFGVDEHAIRDAAFLVLPIALSMLLGSLLAGLHKPLLAQILGPTTHRSVLLALAAGALAGAAPASAHTAVGLVVFAWIVPAVILAICLWRAWPDDWKPAANRRQIEDEGLERGWLRTARSYAVALLPLVILEESGILLMELVHSSEDAVGVYAAAHRTAGLPMIALAAARQLAVPDLASALKQGPQAFEARLRPYLRFIFALGAAIWLLFVVLGDPILSLFGHATEQGHLILVLLGGAYVVFLISGLAAPVLQLHGQHKVVIGCMATLLVASLAVGLPAVRLGGGEGLSAAFAAVNVFVLGYLMLQVRRRTGVRYLGLLRPDPA